MRSPEHHEQVAVVNWARFMADTGRLPELALLYAVPNGGHREKATAGRLKAEGTRRGVPDLCLPVPRLTVEGGYLAGLYVEMKAPGGSTSPEQRAWIAALGSLGYRAVVCRGADAAKAEIESYLALPRVAPLTVGDTVLLAALPR